MARGGRGERRTVRWISDFGAPRRGAGGHYEVFIPEEIGNWEPTLTASTIELIGRAEMSIADLNRRDRAPASLEGLARQLLRSEALASSQIEGLSISHRKLAQASIDGLGTHRANEILGNIRAIERAIELGSTSAPMTPQDIAEIHRAMAIVPPLLRIAGQFREEQGWIGGDSPVTAEFVPAPHEEIPRLLDDLCEFINRDDLPPTVQAAIAHAQFETIHPFGDGNGRVGRCLIHAILRRRGLAPKYVPPISLVLGANKNSYINGLQRFQEDRVEEWVAQFARASAQAARRAEEFSDAINQLQAEWLDRAAPMRSDATARSIIANLAAYPFITVKIVEELTGRSNVAALNGLAHLTANGILTRHGNRRKGDSWEAGELFDLLAQFEDTVRDEEG